MNIIKIAHKEWLQNVRNVPVMLIMTIMPIAIIMMMGMALSGAFSGEATSLENIDIEYQVVGNGSIYSDSVKGILSSLLKEEGQLLELDDLDKSIEKVKDTEIALAILIDDNEEQITIYKNDFYMNKSAVIENIIKNFTVNYNVATEIISNGQTYRVTDFKTSFRSLSKKNLPSSMDYYGVVMTMLFAFYGIVSPFSNTVKEKNKGTLDRILTTSVGAREVLFGKILGNFMVNSLQLAIVLGSVVIFFGVNLGNHVVLAVLLMLSLVFLIITLGISIGFLLKNEDVGQAIIHTSIVFFGFFGGAYMPLYGLGFMGQVGKFFSPLWWSINGMMDMVYGDELSTLFTALAINIVAALIFVVFTSFMVNKRGGKYA